jgi:hypothetical protein
MSRTMIRSPRLGRRRGCSASETIVFHSFTRRNHSFPHSFNQSITSPPEGKTTTTTNNYDYGYHQQPQSLHSPSHLHLISSPRCFTHLVRSPGPTPFSCSSPAQPASPFFVPDDSPPAPFAQLFCSSSTFPTATTTFRSLRISSLSLPFPSLPSLSLSLSLRRIASHRLAHLGG